MKLSEDHPRVRPMGVLRWERDDGGRLLSTIDYRYQWAVRWKERTFIDTLYEPTGTRRRARGGYTRHEAATVSNIEGACPTLSFTPAGNRSFERKIRSVAPKPQTSTVSAGDRLLGR